MKKFFCYGKKDFCENTDLCIECPHFAGAGGEYRDAPMNNADMIRAMSDEELERFLDRVYCKGWNNGANDNSDQDPNYHEWLQQPAEETDNG